MYPAERIYDRYLWHSW